ncbi:MAG: DUF3341 domain-containing protein [Gemmatimonadota bacterium]|jgi:hypothetical protein|nr:MAG: DUF3341 domain-containing protein [Gemmatimonadota bacterium]
MNTSEIAGVIAQYGSMDSTRDAILTLREAGFEDLEIYSPIPAPDLEEAMGIYHSPVRLWALIGGITGCTLGFLLPAGASLAYPLVTQGKPIVSLPPFIVVMFELTVLLTGIFSLFAMLVHARKPKLKLAPSYRREFSVDRWGIFVPADPGRRAEAERVLGETAALSLEVTA